MTSYINLIQIIIINLTIHKLVFFTFSSLLQESTITRTVSIINLLYELTDIISLTGYDGL